MFFRRWAAASRTSSSRAEAREDTVCWNYGSSMGYGSLYSVIDCLTKNYDVE